MNTYEVRAVRWRGGWELHIEGEGVTQCRTLGQAAQQVHDYLETLHDRSFDDAHFAIEVDLEGIQREEIEAVKAETRLAADAQVRAAAHSRELVSRLRAEGLSVSDIASLMSVSRGRVSQLLEREAAAVR